MPIEVNPFNSALGTLTGITLNLGASFAGTIGVENLSDTPDMAAGIIAGSVTITNNGGSLAAEVFPSAQGPTHDLTAFDGVIDFAGTSGATDSVSGPTASTTVTALPSVFQSFLGANEIFLTLTAKTFPLVQGMENETVQETANATATVTLTYNYTPVTAVPEPAIAPLTAIGIPALIWINRRRRPCAPAMPGQ